MTYQLELSSAKKAALKAGKYLAKEFIKFHRQQADHKSRHELVTKCDKRAEKIILQTLKKRFPKLNFLSEEKGANHKNPEYLWIIDPLDGTNNFVVHNPLFSVAIALAHDKQIVMSVIYVPMLKELYWATSRGTYKNGRKISVSRHHDVKEMFLTYCHGKSLADNKKAFKLYEYYHLHAHECRHFGSTSIELAMVASGQTDSLVVSGPNLWDVAAGIMLVKNAGGHVTDWQGRPWQLHSKSVLASNKKLQPQILRELKKLRVA
ncbi:MAG: inositol monophosphatase family protein [Patescibacteria group bacterium]